MNVYSKQYLELKGEYFTPAEPFEVFDIDEIFSEMPKSSIHVISCSGFKFTGLERDADENIFCLFGDEWHNVAYSNLTETSYLPYVKLI